MQKLRLAFIFCLPVLLSSCNPFRNLSNREIGPVLIGIIIFLGLILFVAGRMMLRR